MERLDDEGMLKGIVNKVDPTGEAKFLLTALGAGGKAYHTGELAKIARLFSKPSVKYQDMAEARKAAYGIVYKEQRAEMLQGILGVFQGGNKAMGEIAKRSGEGVCKDAVCALENSYNDMEKSTKTGQVSGSLSYEREGKTITDQHAMLLAEKDGQVRLEDPTNKFNQLFPEDVTTIAQANKYIADFGLPLPYGKFKTHE